MKTLITPELASSLLDNNRNNRTIVQGNLSFLKNEIKEGRFLYNGESIIISDEGNLLDGQHRLLAIKETGISVEINLVQGVQEKAMATIDTGATRTAGAVFSINNVKNSNSISSMCKKIIEKQNTNRVFDDNGNIKLSHQQILDFYVSKKDILVAIHDYCLSLYNSNVKVMPASDAGAYLYLFGLESRLAKQFIREIMTGRQEGDSNYSILLRDRLINDKISNFKITGSKKRDFVISAFRGYLKGNNVKQLNSKGDQSFLKGDINKLKNKLDEKDF